jgi:hypothetical protein
MRLPGIAGVKDLNTNRATGHRTARPRVPSDENGRSSGATGGLTWCVPLQLPRAWGATCPRNAVEPMWLMELSSGWLYRKTCHLLPGYSKDPHPHLGRIARTRVGFGSRFGRVRPRIANDRRWTTTGRWWRCSSFSRTDPRRRAAPRPAQPRPPAAAPRPPRGRSPGLLRSS